MPGCERDRAGTSSRRVRLCASYTQHICTSGGNGFSADLLQIPDTRLQQAELSRTLFLALGEQDHCSKTPVAAAMANPEPERLTEVDIPKLPLYLAFGVIFGVAPMLPNRYNRDLVYLVSTIYKRVGPIGLLGIPFCTLAMEKTAYDTYTAYHGRSIYADAAKRNEPPPQFPSGGAQLPSFSLIETRKLVADPVVFRLPWIQNVLRRRETNQ